MRKKRQMSVDFQLLPWLRTLDLKSEPWQTPTPTPGFQSSPTRWFLAGKMDAELCHLGTLRDCRRLQDWRIPAGTRGMWRSSLPSPDTSGPLVMV